ncbi:MAG: DEAD/DEAH box helicase, partial [Burkholderiaceae bacterium]
MDLPIQPPTHPTDQQRNPPEDCLLVAVDSPGVGLLSYRQPDEAATIGDWVIVPVGSRQLVGLVVDLGPPPEGVTLKQAVVRCTDLPSCGREDLDYIKFVSTYYRRQIGQTVGTMVPAWLRQPAIFEQRVTKKGLAPSRLQRLLAKPVPTFRDLVLANQDVVESGPPALAPQVEHPGLTDQQRAALAFLSSQNRPTLLYGITGSGKTQGYLSMMDRLLAEQPDAQILLLVPEIGLTQALIHRLARAFPDQTVAVLHSGLADQARAHHWLNAATGRARLVVGTRTAILCPLPRLGLLVVDEEHDHSYKQQEGLRYSARDLAVWLADQRRIRLILGSATPSLESRAQVERGRYGLIQLTERATGASPATVQLVDL